MTSTLRTRSSLPPWYAVEFANSFACTLLTTGCYEYAGDVLNAPASVRLWLSAAWGFSYIFIALLAGRLAEKLGQRRAVLLASAGCVVSALLGLLAIAVPSVWMLLAIMLPYNFTSTMIWPAVESALSREKAKLPLTSRMALYNLSWGSSGFIALFLRGALERTSWSLIFIVPAAANLLGFLVLLVFGHSGNLRHRERAADDPAAAHELDEPAMRRRATTLLHMAWLGNALAYVAINVLIPVMLYVGKETGVTGQAGAAALTSGWSFTRFAGFALVWAWGGWHYKARYLIAAQAALAAAFLFMLALPSLGVTSAGAAVPMLLAAEVVFGFAAALIYSSALYYAMHVSEGHGGHAGFHESLIGMGVAVGPTVGALAGTGELGAPALMRIGVGVTAVLAVGVCVMAVMGGRNRRPA